MRYDRIGTTKGQKEFKPSLKNRILVLSGFFCKISGKQPHSFYTGVPLLNTVKLNLRLGSDKNNEFMIFVLSFRLNLHLTHVLEWKTIFTRGLKAELFFFGIA